MAEKRIVSPEDRPHAILEMMLRGPRVPEDFSCDGCTSSPDLHFVWACNVHDYESAKSSENWKLLMDAVNAMLKSNDGAFDSQFRMEEFWVYRAETGNYHWETPTIKQGFEIWFDQFEGMRERLQHNINILSKWRIKGNRLVKRSRFDPKRFMGYRLSRLYARATGVWYTDWAE